MYTFVLYATFGALQLFLNSFAIFFHFVASSLDVVGGVPVVDQRHLHLPAVLFLPCLQRPEDGVLPHLDLRRNALPEPLPQRTLRGEQEVDGVRRQPDHGGAAKM